MSGASDFAHGIAVIITDVRGVEHRALARSGVEGTHKDGKRVHDFPVVWVDVRGSTGKAPTVCPGR